MRRAESEGETLVTINSTNLVPEMVSALPTLQGAVEKERIAWLPDTPGLHVTCGDILVPALEAALDSGADAAERSRLFDFVERMADSPDPAVVNVVEATVCESLLNKTEARSHMRPKTLAASIRTEEHLNRLATSGSPLSRIVDGLKRKFTNRR